MRKNKLKWTILLCCTCFVIGGCKNEQPTDSAQSTENKGITVEDIAAERVLNSDALYWGYSYEELKENADVIVKVKVLDNLTSENSLADYDGENGWVTRFCSVRNVQAVEFYKNSRIILFFTPPDVETD